MPRDERTLQSPTRENLQPAKPEPPDNLWELIDAAIAGLIATGPPPNSFTIAQYRAKKNLSRHHACAHIAKLVEAGKLKKLRIGQQTYFQLV